MNNKIYLSLLSAATLLILSSLSHADTQENVSTAVWANEAIVATYTFNYKTYLEQQKEIAHYFTSEGWIAYNKALNAAKLPEMIQQNAYTVTAVATAPPRIVTLDPTHWEASMPLLVVYQNAQYEQKQNLNVRIRFTKTPSGQGVRGLGISSLKTSLTEPACQCPKKPEEPKQEVKP